MSGTKRQPRRHECDVTATRLGNAVEKYADKLTGEEKDEISHIIFALDQIADGER